MPIRLLLRALLFIACASGLLMGALPARAAVMQPVTELRLANGLRVIISPGPTSPDVTVVIRYEVGHSDEPSGLDGIAHLVEHLMFDGSRHVASGEFWQLLERSGATNINGETAVDATTYHETVPPDRLELALWLESDRMGYLLDRVDEAALARARAAIQNEYKDRVIDQPLGVVPALMLAELFPPWHPYSHRGGKPATHAAITLADARAFFGTWYGPANATLVIAGNVQVAAAAALAQRYFGSLPARRPPTRPSLPALDPLSPVVLRVEAGLTREEVRMAWVAPRLLAPGDLELDLVAAILVARDGWLHRRLFGSDAIATHLVVREDSRRLASIFRIEVAVAPGHTSGEVIAIIDDTLARFEHGLTTADVERAQRAWYNAKLFGLESNLAFGLRLAAFAGRLPGRPLPSFYDGDLAQYAAIGPDAVRRTVRAVLGRSHRVVVTAHPTRGRPQSGVLRLREEVAL
jgi:predicted Zn-dependent peptidase